MSLYGKGTPKDEHHGKSHVRKNDTGVVLSGRDKGKQGKVLRVSPLKGTAIIERVNFLKKHTKANPGKNQQGGILERESPIAVDKLQVVCPSCGEPTRARHRHTEDTTTRTCRKCNAEM
jgi:large subunit ribosomal protein L24